MKTNHRVLAYESMRLEGDWKIPTWVRPLHVVSMTVVSSPLYFFLISDKALAGDATRKDTCPEIYM